MEGFQLAEQNNERTTSAYILSWLYSLSQWENEDAPHAPSVGTIPSRESWISCFQGNKGGSGCSSWTGFFSNNSNSK